MSAVVLGLLSACGGATEGDPDALKGNGLGDCPDCVDGKPDVDDDTPSDDGTGTGGVGGTAGTGSVGEDAGSADPPPNSNGGSPASDGGSDAPSLHGYAIYQRDVPPLDIGSGGSTGSSGGVPPLDPNTLFLVVGTSGATCEDHWATADCGEWEVTLVVPPDKQQVGTIPLSELNAHFSEATPPYDDAFPDDCGFGGGSFFDGTLDITEIDAEHVVFQLTDTWKLSFDADGTYSVEVCGTAE